MILKGVYFHGRGLIDIRGDHAPTSTANIPFWSDGD
jgi:hypothetical protein